MPRCHQEEQSEKEGSRQSSFTYNLGNNVTTVGREESMYSHDEASVIFWKLYGMVRILYK